jgi:multiple sugar transport system permease protein
MVARRRNKTRTGVWGYLSHAGAWAYGLVLAVPLYYLIITTSKSNVDIFNSPAALPSTWSLDNFFRAWDFAALPQAMGNSAFITGASEIVTLALALPAAYGLARAEGRLSRLVERVFAAGFLIPAFAALVPTALLAINIGLFYNPLFLVLFFPATQMPLSVLLLTQFMRSIPKDVEESAMMDGASRWAILWRIYTPMIVPGIVTVAVLNFLTFWNDYLFSLVILGTDTATRTVQVAIPTLIGQSTQFGVLAAANVISLIPVFVVYTLLQRRSENALVAGAVKG